MKPNKLSKGHNLLWESSRMMLPEHKGELARHKRETMRRKKPELDEQHMEEVARMIQDYVRSDVYLHIVIFGEYGDRDYKAKITKFDPYLRRMKLEWDDAFEWVSIDNIVDIFI